MDRSWSALLALPAFLLANCSQPAPNARSLRLYAMDCGRIDVSDMATFSRNGEFSGQSYSLAVPCYLIRHPKGDLIWDIGLDQALADLPNGIEGGGFRSSVSVRLIDQLRELELAPADIDYVAISHAHPDHAGNGDMFAGATFVVSAAERAFMFADEARANPDFFRPYAALENAKTVTYEKSLDLFGDGRVVMTTMPGHTPGSAVLLLRLENAGPALLTGDLITHAEGRRIGAIPEFNLNAEQTAASLEEFEALAAAEGARVIIQHEPADFDALPAFPAWLD